jgi:hypothetical protein
VSSGQWEGGKAGRREGGKAGRQEEFFEGKGFYEK